MANIELTAQQVKDFIKYHIENNKELVKLGQLPIAVSISGEAGLGKTSAVVELAEELDMDFVKFCPQQCSEVSDISGYPIRQFFMCHPDTVKKIVFEKNEKGENIKREITEKFDGETCLWVDEQAISQWVEKGYRNSGKKRMAYCPPEWVAGHNKPIILLIDDWTRAQKRHLQALMELILTQSFIGWNLPKGSMVVLTENEAESGKYDVQDIDPAMRTRFMTVTQKFDLPTWAKWAESAHVDSRCINFLLMNPEIMSGKDDRINARSITMFFNSLRALGDFAREENLQMVRQNGIAIGEVVVNTFIQFIHNKLDKLPTPQEMIEDTNVDSDGTPTVINTMVGLVNTDRYRADIATVLATRLINYTIQAANDKNFDQKKMKRFEEILLNENIFKSDIRMRVCKATIGANVGKFKTLVQNPGIQALLFPKTKK